MGERALHRRSERCPCGKVSYLTKDDAKRARRYGTRLVGVSPYRCPTDPDIWHLGHLPKAVIEGRLGREAFRRDGR